MTRGKVAEQVSIVVPLLKLCRGARVVVYGHLPDYMLAKHTSLLRRARRAPIDALEGRTTCVADALLVNILFTKQVVYSSAFCRQLPAQVDVLYPCVRVPSDADIEH